MDWLEEAEQNLAKLMELVPPRSRQRVEGKVRTEIELTARKVGGDRVTAHHVTLGFVNAAPKSALRKLEWPEGDDIVWYEEYFH
jgi:hypothetical protein